MDTLHNIKRIIIEKGYYVYEVGGVVRDKNIGIESNDIDLVTNAPIENLKAYFDEANLSWVSALDKTETKVLIVEGHEIAEFRKDSYDTTGNFKEAVSGTLEEDALRRDFTINALYEDANGDVIDLVGGLEDIQDKIIRTCGEPLARFKEDASRIIRAAYLAAKLNFKIDKIIIDCVKNNKSLLENIHPALYGKMIMKVLKAGVFSNFLEKLEEMDIVFDVFPEWKNQWQSPQNPKYHNLTVWEHTKAVVRSAEKRHPNNPFYILAAFCHDVGKSHEEIRTIRNGQPSDLGHEEFGAGIAYAFITRLELGKNHAHFVKLLTEFHGIRPSLTNKSMKKAYSKIAPYFKNKSELENFTDYLLDIMLDDASGFAPEFSSSQLIYVNELILAKEKLMKETIFYKHELPVDGRYIQENSNFKGKKIGDFLDRLVKENIQDLNKINLLLNTKN